MKTKTKTKARGKILSQWSYCPDVIYHSFNLNLDSTDYHVESEYDGDVSKLESFIEDCESGCFIDYDGHASEILLNGMIVYNKTLYPTDVVFFRNKLRELNKKHDGKLEIVWYNR